MPIIIFLFKLLFKALAIFGIVKFYRWVFDCGLHGESMMEDVSWLEMVKARPWLMLKPVLFSALTLLFFAVWIYYFNTSEDAFAAAGREIFSLIWQAIKWPFIIITIYGLNWLNYQLFFNSKHDQNWLDEFGWAFSFLAPIFSLVMGYRSVFWGIINFLAINALLLWGVYYQLPEATQYAIDSWLNNLREP